MKEARDKNLVCTAVLTDLTKVFDCFKHDLFGEKLHAFGFDKNIRELSWMSHNVSFCSFL